MGENLCLDQATSREREILAPLRAAQWRGALSTEEYSERNRRLYGHPYGYQRIQTWALRDEAGSLLTSFDALEIDLGVKRDLGELKEEKGVLVASVITAPENRSRGYSSRLITEYFRANPHKSGILYSDLGPPFYRRFGFVESPIKCVEIAAGGGFWLRPAWHALSLGNFVEKQRELRRQKLADSPRPGLTLLPTPAWLDWQVERYRYFAETRGRKFPETIFWAGTHSGNDHLLAAVPDFIAGRMEGFWFDAHCGSCLAAMHALASVSNLPAIRFWSGADTAWPGKVECPMVRVDGLAADPAFIDPQFCDWW